MGSRSLLRLAFGVVTLLFAGLTAGAIWLRVGPLPEPPTIVLQPSKPTAPVVKNASKFEFVMQAYGMGRDGSEFCSMNFETRDGTKVSRRIEWFRSAAAARKAMREEARDADAMGRERACGTAGDRARERAVLRQRAIAGEEPWFTVTWREGKTVVSIRSHSLDDALEFEREYLECEQPADPAKLTPRSSAG